MSFNYFTMSLLAAVVCISCKNTKETAVVVPDNNIKINELSTISQEKEKYRLTVSFYSIGQGTDSEHHQKFKDYLKNYSPDIKFEQIAWGREGEQDYCLKLMELSPKEQEKFIKNVRILLEKSDLVHIKENEECVHKR